MTEAKRGFFPLVIGDRVSLKQGGAVALVAKDNLEISQGGGQLIGAGNRVSISQGGGWVIGAGGSVAIDRGGPQSSVPDMCGWSAPSSASHSAATSKSKTPEWSSAPGPL